jgi:phosphoribosylanthranilate isomerase
MTNLSSRCIIIHGMPRTRIKICGITRPEDAALAAELGADAIGLNFFSGPRKISLNRATDILSVVPPLLTPVALTSGPVPAFPDAPTIAEIQAGPLSADRAPLRIHVFQYYGTSLYLESDVAAAKVQIWSVCRLVDAEICAQVLSHVQSLSFYASTLVFDVAVPGLPGGTGRTLNWRALAGALPLLLQKETFRTIILAGGLTPDNVADAIRIAQPYAVDVSSGVEFPGQPGIKDPARLRAFIQAVRSTDTP